MVRLDLISSPIIIMFSVVVQEAKFDFINMKLYRYTEVQQPR